MKIAKLKKVRVGVSLIFFVLIFFLYVDYGNTLSIPVVKSVLYMQFIPSLVKFVNIFSLGAASGFIIITIVTFFYGRVYCSTFCPLGTLQDIISRISWKLSPKKKRKQFFGYKVPNSMLRNTILALTVVTFMLGSHFLIALLDPYSNFGRITTLFAQPLAGLLHNGTSSILENADLYWIYPVEIRNVVLTSLIIPLIMLGLVTILSARNGRLFCNTVCPVGSLLGIFSKFSMYKIAINTHACNSCGLCVFQCKAGCIDEEKQEVDFSRCVSCMNCFDSCNKDAFYYKNTWGSRPEPVKAQADTSKRTFMANSFIFLGGIMGLSSFQFKKDTTQTSNVYVPDGTTIIKEKREFRVTPPGSKNLENFNKYCTACGLCVSACRSNVLQPSFLEYGLSGMMQPHMDYHSGFCNYDCKICGDVCPSQAINVFHDLKEKQLTQLGKAKFVKGNCIVNTERTECGACSEHCPTKAVDMVPFLDTGLMIPKVDDTICVGCGACEFACPTVPYRAIYVNGNAEHLIADEPKIEELEELEEEEDFPF